jgi:hypothetical protein
MNASDISHLPISLYDFFYHDIVTKHVIYYIKMYVDQELWDMSGRDDIALKCLSKIEQYKF